MDATIRNRLAFVINTFFCIATLIFAGCKDSSTGPETQPVYGITGKVCNSDGIALEGVRFYCLYYLYDFPIDSSFKVSLNKGVKKTDYTFELYQSFPNPCAHSFYIRYSLPESCAVELTILSKKMGKVIYAQSESLSYGFYQNYFNNFVDNYGVTNGIYRYQLKARGSSGRIYEMEKELFIVSDGGTQNATTNFEGRYFFDGRDAFIGDSVAIMNGETLLYYQHLTNNVRLTVMKDGYQSTYFETELISSTILNVDVILSAKP